MARARELPTCLRIVFISGVIALIQLVLIPSIGSSEGQGAALKWSDTHHGRTIELLDALRQSRTVMKALLRADVEAVDSTTSKDQYSSIGSPSEGRDQERTNEVHFCANVLRNPACSPELAATVADILMRVRRGTECLHELVLATRDSSLFIKKSLNLLCLRSFITSVFLHGKQKGSADRDGCESDNFDWFSTGRKQPSDDSRLRVAWQPYFGEHNTSLQANLFSIESRLLLFQTKALTLGTSRSEPLDWNSGSGELEVVSVSPRKDCLSRTDQLKDLAQVVEHFIKLLNTTYDRFPVTCSKCCVDSCWFPRLTSKNRLTPNCPVTRRPREPLKAWLNRLVLAYCKMYRLAMCRLEKMAQVLELSLHLHRVASFSNSLQAWLKQCTSPNDTPNTTSTKSMGLTTNNLVNALTNTLCVKIVNFGQVNYARSAGCSPAAHCTLGCYHLKAILPSMQFLNNTNQPPPRIQLELLTNLTAFFCKRSWEHEQSSIYGTEVVTDDRISSSDKVTSSSGKANYCPKRVGLNFTCQYPYVVTENPANFDEDIRSSFRKVAVRLVTKVYDLKSPLLLTNRTTFPCGYSCEGHRIGHASSGRQMAVSDSVLTIAWLLLFSVAIVNLKRNRSFSMLLTKFYFVVLVYNLSYGIPAIAIQAARLAYRQPPVWCREDGTAQQGPIVEGKPRVCAMMGKLSYFGFLVSVFCLLVMSMFWRLKIKECVDGSPTTGVKNCLVKGGIRDHFKQVKRDRILLIEHIFLAVVLVVLLVLAGVTYNESRWMANPMLSTCQVDKEWSLVWGIPLMLYIPSCISFSVSVYRLGKVVKVVRRLERDSSCKNGKKYSPFLQRTRTHLLVYVALHSLTLVIVMILSIVGYIDTISKVEHRQVLDKYLECAMSSSLPHSCGQLRMRNWLWMHLMFVIKQSHGLTAIVFLPWKAWEY